jgi:hypothetical protein
VASLKGDNLVVLFYLSATEIWPDKRGGGLSHGGQLSSIASSVQLKYGLIRKVASLMGDNLVVLHHLCN